LLKQHPEYLQQFPQTKAGTRRFQIYRMVDRADTYIQHFFLKQTYQTTNTSNNPIPYLNRYGIFLPKILNSYKEDITMIKGLAITPPVLGRISIGKIVEKNGKRLPEKDDQFTITSQIQNKDGWVKHPLDEQLRAKAQNQKLRSIPVRMIFNDPELNLGQSTAYLTAKLDA
jgi:hypothetical protein